jgi:UDP-galactopyranose mutase
MKNVIVVGCGLSGAVAAREIAEKFSDVRVNVYDRRNHIAGNMFDYIDSHGILVHKYGPHTFHTKKKNLFDYIQKYGEWIDYSLTCRAKINGIQTPSPFNYKTIDDFFPNDADRIKEAFRINFPNCEYVTVLEALNASNRYIKEYAQFLFDNDYKLYSAKQWGCSPKEIDPSILARVPLRMSYKDGYFDDLYQVMPKTSYVDFFFNLLKHPSIHCSLNIDALRHIAIKDNQIFFDGRYVDLFVFTGALDELFSCKFGKLPYRSLRFEWFHDESDSIQDAPVVAYPQAEGFTRITEYKKLPCQNVQGTTYAVEYSLPYKKETENMEPYYPLLTSESQNLYKKYENEAYTLKNMVYCGRLANFKYFNMDQALENVLNTINSEKVSSLLR